MRPAPAIRSAQVSAAVSFDDVYRAHVRDVARWVERLGGPGVDRDEAVQEVFVTVSRRLPEFRGEAKLSTWLFRITARVVANHRRAARRRGLWTRLSARLLEALPSAHPTPGDALEERQAGERFYRVLDSLPDRYREVLILFELEELSTDDIARVVDRPPGTVRVWLHRARAQFARRWRAQQRAQEAEE